VDGKTVASYREHLRNSADGYERIIERNGTVYEMDVATS
jgi:hypothetical protein